MRLVNYALLIFLLSGSCLAVDNPKTFNKKDLIEKVDRSELESTDKTVKNNATVDVPKFEMPSIEFDKAAGPKTDKKPVVNKTKKKPNEAIAKAKHKAAPKVKSEAKPEDKNRVIKK